jgi:2-iminobutanoate/2-iminopropanoate deaminase
MSSDMKQVIFPEGGPQPVGPYSPVVVSGDLVYVSGHVGFDPAAGGSFGETFEEQCQQTFKNLARALGAAGCDFSHVVKTTAFLTRAEDFAAFNEIYGQHVPAPYPARSTVVAALVIAGLLVEVEVIARRP